MATIRTNCPTCGPVDLDATEISLRIARDDETGNYGFTCPDCQTTVDRPANRKTLALLVAAGVDVERVDHEELRPELPFEDRPPVSDAPAFTLDDVIAFHFLLEDDVFLEETLSLGH